MANMAHLLDNIGSSLEDDPEPTRPARVAILGYGDQGKSAYNYWIHLTDDVTIHDVNEDLNLPANVKHVLGPDYLRNLDRYDVLVRSPSLHPRDIVAANYDTPSILASVTSNTNEFLRVCPTANIIGVTGTKGKGTTSTLIAKMLEAALKNTASSHTARVHLGGNIGIPPLELLRNDIQPQDWVVLELANFQLIDLKYSPPLAVCLMVVPEHMDWHSDMAEYIEAKQQLFRWQSLQDITIYNAEDRHSAEVAAISPGRKLPFMQAPGAYVNDGAFVINGQDICATSELKLLGKHNWQNVCAAITAVSQVSEDYGAMRSVLTSFTGLEHRLEFVREVAGVKYYDDSFGTTPDTAIVAIEAFDEYKVMILGGSDKGAHYDQLAETVRRNKVRRVISIGLMGAKIADELELSSYHDVTEGGKSMTSIVAAAAKAAKLGDVVILSPACASFDMFKNYKDRGEQFQKAVMALSEAPAEDSESTPEAVAPATTKPAQES